LYRIATNYLTALDIDLRSVSTTNRLIVEQPEFHSDRGLVPSPMMEVYWGDKRLRDPGKHGVAFKISAVSGQLLEMSVGNAAGCKGLPLIRDFEELIAIPDEEFLRYSDIERSNLVVRFANLPTQFLPSSTNISFWFNEANRFAATNAPSPR
jgi:hypothetical protein